MLVSADVAAPMPDVASLTAELTIDPMSWADARAARPRRAEIAENFMLILFVACELDTRKLRSDIEHYSAENSFRNASHGIYVQLHGRCKICSMARMLLF